MLLEQLDEFFSVRRCLSIRGLFQKVIQHVELSYDSKVSNGTFLSVLSSENFVSILLMLGSSTCALFTQTRESPLLCSWPTQKLLIYVALLPKEELNEAQQLSKILVNNSYVLSIPGIILKWWHISIYPESSGICEPLCENRTFP